jgi:hypothetical protein
MSITSPYAGVDPDYWVEITEGLIMKHPLKPEEIVSAARKAWEDIFTSSIGGFRIGVEMFPKPQIMAFLLQELVTLELVKLHPGEWRGDQTATDKDLVYLPDEHFSVEIKASSNARHIYGNRSYAQESTTATRKQKSGYYLAINFQPFLAGQQSSLPASDQPKILKIRFGWLDHTDWRAQEKPTGQQASINRQSESAKLLELYPHDSLGDYKQKPMFSIE